jgi:ADP-dependent NAD(P)H-hydrate dehydratase / NAD(P)H-hydrate epimerase
MWIATVPHIREIDRRSTDEFGIPPRVLMERAASAVLEAVQAMQPSGRVTVLCGRGNNGGDGLAFARLAHERGYAVDAVVAAERGRLGELAAEQLEAATARGVPVMFEGHERWGRKLECLASRDLLVDALLGIGATGEVAGAVREVIAAINRSGVPVVSVDVPSGIEADTGEELGESVWARRTVTFGLPKRFLFQGIGLEHSGDWSVADIGFPHELLSEPTDAMLVGREWAVSMLPERLRSGHKGDSGSVLVVAGSERMPGAATLCALGALRAGAGLVTVASVPAVCRTVAALLPEVLLLPLAEEDGAVSPDAAETLLGMRERFDAAAFGPGLTHSPPVKEFFRRLWPEWDLPCVVDADALNAVAEKVALPRAPFVLTPHPGEMGRLLRASVAEIQSDRFRHVRQAASRFGRCCLLKGPFTLVAETGQPTAVNSTGNPGMATGGMGDVLTGVVAALLGQDLPPYHAAACGAYWHGAAADLCAAEIGGIGYTARDVANALPPARVNMMSSCYNE